MPVRDLLNAASGTGGATDPYFYDVSLLLNGDGTNGAQNNTFLDSSTNNFTITRNGNTTQGSFSPYGNLWSTFFNTSSGNYLTSSATNTSNFGSGNYTMELWLNTSSATTKQIFYDGRPTGSQSGTQVLIGISNSTGGTLFIANSSGLTVNGSTVLASNTWYHIAFVRSGTGSNQCAIYVNGVLDVNYTDAYTYTTSNNTIGSVAYTPQGANPVLGYMSNMRFGSTAVYTTAFTPSTTPLTAISGTKMLILQSNRFIDNSTNANTFSVTGTPSVQRFSPFNPTAPYSTTTIGGSGYFDGSSYLSSDPSIFTFGSGTDFSCEGWFYLPSNAITSTYMQVAGNTVNSGTHVFGWFFTTSYIVVSQQYVSDTIDAPWTPIYNQWFHVAIVRTSGTLSIYLNGIRIGTTSDSRTYISNGNALLGNCNNGSSGTFQIYNGYIAGFRVCNGTAAYSASGTTITVPTTPLTSTPTTTWLVNMTNAGIPDLAMQNDLQTVGSAQVSTSIKKYGTGSLSFNGSNSGLTSPAQPSLNFGGDFTIEMWAYPTALSGEQFLFGQNNYSSYYAPVRLEFNNNFFQVLLSTTGSSWSLRFDSGASSFSNNNWYHLAVTRSGTTVTLWVNGASYGTGTLSGALYNSTDTLKIGWANIGAGAFYFSGYLDDIRVTNGLARYTSAFTPPTSALPTY